jgi:hypothetical protein
LVLSASPLDSPGIYDKLVVSGRVSPGVFQLQGGERSYNWDKKKAAGAQGATSTYLGWNPTDGIKGKFLVWTNPDIFELTDEFLPLFQYDASKQSPKPVQVYHPVLALNQITAVTIDSIGPLTPEGKGLWSVTVEMSEFRPAPKKNAVATPAAAGAANAGEAGEQPPDVPPVILAQRQQIEDLHEEYDDPG